MKKTRVRLLVPVGHARGAEAHGMLSHLTVWLEQTPSDLKPRTSVPEGYAEIVSGAVVDEAPGTLWAVEIEPGDPPLPEAPKPPPPDPIPEKSIDRRKGTP